MKIHVFNEGIVCLINYLVTISFKVQVWGIYCYLYPIYFSGTILLISSLLMALALLHKDKEIVHLICTILGKFRKSVPKYPLLELHGWRRHYTGQYI